MNLAEFRLRCEAISLEQPDRLHIDIVRSLVPELDAAVVEDLVVQAAAMRWRSWARRHDDFGGIRPGGGGPRARPGRDWDRVSTVTDAATTDGRSHDADTDETIHLDLKSRAEQFPLASRFWMKGHSTLTVGSATAEQHRKRSNQLRNQARTLLRQAQMHRNAAELIEATGVTCLDDLLVRTRASRTPTGPIGNGYVPRP